MFGQAHKLFIAIITICFFLPQARANSETLQEPGPSGSNQCHVLVNTQTGAVQIYAPDGTSLSTTVTPTGFVNVCAVKASLSDPGVKEKVYEALVAKRQNLPTESIERRTISLALKRINLASDLMKTKAAAQGVE